MNKGSSDLLTTKLDKTHTFLHSTYIPPCTAIPDRASTGPEQGFPCIVFQHRENPVFISWHCINGTIICSCLLSTVKLRAVDRTTNQFWNFLAKVLLIKTCYWSQLYSKQNLFQKVGWTKYKSRVVMA